MEYIEKCEEKYKTTRLQKVKKKKKSKKNGRSSVAIKKSSTFYNIFYIRKLLNCAKIITQEVCISFIYKVIH